MGIHFIATLDRDLGTVNSGLLCFPFYPKTVDADGIFLFDRYDMSKVPLAYICVVLIPAVMIVGLYFFDQSVASQMAQ